MSALQKAFSRREKIAKMISALEEMKMQGEISEERYSEFKTNYDGMLNDSIENLKEIRSKIKEQRDKIQAEVEELSEEAKLVEIRGKTGEHSPEQVRKALSAIHAKRSALQQQMASYKSQLEARSSTDLGGAVEVEMDERIEFQPEKRFDGQSMDAFLGEVKGKVKTLKESEMGQSLTRAAARVRGKEADIQGQPSQKRFATDDVNEALNVQEPSGRSNPSAEDFWAFRKMITPILIQILFWIGVVICMAGGLIIIGSAHREHSGTWDGTQVALGLVLVVLGPLLVRICCEFLILFFRMNETLTEIKNKLE